MSDLLLKACRDAAAEAAAYIRARATTVDQIDWQVKSRADFVSEVDTAAEEQITRVLLRAFPDAQVMGEELAPSLTLGDGVTFIVDPLDGTTNFLHGYPQYGVSIAAVAGGVLEAGVVHDVPRDIVYAARRGGGAWCDGTRMRVSTTTEPLRALIGTGFPFKDREQLDPYLPQFVRMASATSGLRRAGAAALDLADVAGGRLDGFWELMLAPWDMAAGLLLVREAGGRATDFSGTEVGPSQSGLVASNGVMHDWMLSQLTTQ